MANGASARSLGHRAACPVRNTYPSAPEN